MPKQRIQKVLAAAGFGSRRHCEELVLDGRVAVNGQAIRTLPVLVDPAADGIAVDGRPIRADKLVYYMLNKPAGVFCTHHDQAGRTRAVDLLIGVRERVFPIGRLDADSMGLLILTNDGPLTQMLTHPRFGVPKTYRVEVAGQPSSNVMEKLRAGVWLSEGRTAPARIEVIHSNRKRTILEITLRESRNREIRRMLAKMGHNVRRLVRVQVGRLSIAKLPLGAFRKLTDEEVKQLKSPLERLPVESAVRTWRPAARKRLKTAGRPSRPATVRGAVQRARRILMPEGTRGRDSGGGRRRV
jgi:23S rRNA pseudouridine2605 synthase